MSHIERLTPRPALHQNCVDFPVSANTVHCIKTAWIFRNCGIASLHHCIKTARIFRAAPTISTSYKLWQTRKNRVARKISAEEHGGYTSTAPTAFGLVLGVEAETAPTTVLPSSSSVRAPQAYALERDRDRDRDRDREITPPHSGLRRDPRHQKETTSMS